MTRMIIILTLIFRGSKSMNYFIKLASSLIFTILAASGNLFAATTFDQKLAELEKSSGGRIGAYVVNTANGSPVKYRANERFPAGCTSKVIGVGEVLSESMKDKSLLAQKVFYTKADLTNWYPITKKHMKTGMTVEQLCAAAISYSDNTAMNLLVKKMGGLEQMNRFARTLHNDSFRQDHDWPKEAESGGLNNASDSSTPQDMANSLQQLAFSPILAKPQQQMLLSWLKANTTGEDRIRAGVPQTWEVGDKTGTGMNYGTTNDLAILWPPKCPPIIMAIYYTNDNNKTAPKREDIIASTTRILLQELAKSDQCIKQGLATS